MTQRRMYRSNARSTTAVTVVPSARAFSTAARQRSSGTRTARGVVLATRDAAGQAGPELADQCDVRALAAHGARGDGSAVGLVVGLLLGRVGRGVRHGSSMARCIYSVKGARV